ncbi:uncharacterized protein [Watersipora subatra]|uniref:uncharacterized protein n=1 Tax=Watersipora subatra TaxID=2589382 RepID=UPI00355C86FC
MSHRTPVVIQSIPPSSHKQVGGECRKTPQQTQVLSHHGRPTTHPSSRKRQQEDYRYSMPPNKKTTSIRDIIGSLKSSDSTTHYQPIPHGLRQIVNRLCKEYEITDAVWTQSPSNPKEIRIRGQGVTKVQKMLMREAESQFPEFSFVTTNSGPLHGEQLFKKLEIVQRRADVAPHSSAWQEAAISKCQLIVTATDKSHPTSDNRKKAFLLTAAHLVLSGDQCHRLLDRTHLEETENVRQELTSQLFNTDYTVRVVQGSNHVNPYIKLEERVMTAYRYYHRNANILPTCDPDYRCSEGKCTSQMQTNCPHTFANDLAVFPVSPDEMQMLAQTIARSSAFHFDEILPVTAQGLRKLRQRTIEPFLEDRRCHLIRPYETVDEEAETVLADYLAFSFTAHESEALVEGDSGSILYIKQANRKLAVAMVTQRIDPDHYQAVLLAPALRDIELDYRHHVADFQPFQFRTGPTPPQQD